MSLPSQEINPLLPALAAYIPTDRVESLVQAEAPLPEDGVALIADISGFTPLTEALTQGLSADQGAEELTAALGSVFTPLIEEVHAFRGSVIKFGGDALIVWYGREPGVRRAAVIRRALTSARRMQRAIKVHGQIPTPIGLVTLRMKVGLAYGPVKRFNLGLPEYGYEDVLGGQTLDRMAEAEHHAQPGEIVLDAETLAYLPEAVAVAEWRDDFAVVEQLLRPARPKPWPPLTWPAHEEELLVNRLVAYVPPEIYQTLSSGLTQVAELRPVVSLFVQFHGIDYDNDPEVAWKLQIYFANAQRAVARYGGRLNRLITGDKGSLIHVIFGAPRTVEEQEARAIRCALDLQQECGGLPFITMQRIGVTVGRVFAGPVGSDSRHDYTTMGDSINLSARLMQNAADDQILMEAAVRARLNADFEVADLGQIRVKGKKEPIPVFAALGLRADLEQKEGKRRRRIRPLFGREREVAILQQQVARLEEAQGGVVTIVGEVGMGKTHLLDYLQRYHETPVTWASSICLAYGEMLSGYLFISLLRDLLDLPAGHTPDDTAQQLYRLCTQLFGPARLEATYPYIARFMGLPLTRELNQRLEGLSGESFRWQLFEVIRELLQLLLARGPVALALDDLQWADATSLRMLETILPLTIDRPLLIFLAMRPEEESYAWALRRRLLKEQSERFRCFDLTLEGLSQPAAASLLSQLAPQLPAQMVAHLVDKGAGNPLFLVEMVRALQMQGLLADDEALQQLPLEALNLPDSVQSLLLAQIDRLGVEARHTLQLAAVIGETFFYEVLANLAAEEQNLFQQLATLEASKYILPDEAGDLGPAYAFRHSMIQESAYSTLLYERRRAYHRQVAETLGRLFPAHIAEQARLLAYHYERAADLEQAIYYYLQAADQARLLHGHQEAETLYQQVLRLLDQQEADGQAQPERRAGVYLKIGQVRANALDFGGAQEFYNQAFNLLEQAGGFSLPPAGPAGGQPRLIRLGVLESGPSTLDPGLCELTEVSEIVDYLFEGLVELDTELNIFPAVARRWQVDESGRQYRFELRDNLAWSDGTSLTAHDFIFAWQRNLRPETEAGRAHLLYGIEGAEAFHRGETADPNTIGLYAPDDFTLEVTLRNPLGYFPYILANPIAFPQPAHRVSANEKEWATPENLVSNGPFRIAQWQPGVEIRLEQNPLYGGFRPGNLEQAQLYFIHPGLEQYLNRQIDWCQVDDRSDLPDRFPQETFLGQYLTLYCLEFSHHVPPFNQRLVRQAFAHCIDKAELVQQVWANVQRPARGGIVPPNLPGHSPEIGLPFEPATGRLLLAQAGYPTGAGLPPLTLAALPGFESTPRYLQAAWREHLGVEVQVIEDLPYKALWESVSQGTAHMALAGWEADYPDPDDLLRVLHSASPLNYRGWQNDEFDQLIDQAAQSSQQATRLTLYRQADRLAVAEETALVPLYYWQNYNLLRAGLELNGAGKIIRASTLKLKWVQVAE